MGLKKKKVIWNPGQVPESRHHNLGKMPRYYPEPEVRDPGLRDAWGNAIIGQACMVIQELYSQSSTYSLYPYPIFRAGVSGWAGEQKLDVGQIVIYLGPTNVDCVSSKSRIISKPYHTIFFNGGKFLIYDPNTLQPLSE